MGTVIVRGHHVALEGAGESGSVVTRAPLIEQKAVNPGIDGIENEVCSISEIVSQACSITLHSSDATDEFSQIPPHAGPGGISIHADKSLNLESAVSAEQRKKQIEDTLKVLDKQSGDLKSSMTAQKSRLRGTKSTFFSTDSAAASSKHFRPPPVKSPCIRIFPAGAVVTVSAYSSGTSRRKCSDA